MEKAEKSKTFYGRLSTATMIVGAQIFDEIKQTLASSYEEAVCWHLETKICMEESYCAFMWYGVEFRFFIKADNYCLLIHPYLDHPEWKPHTMVSIGTCENLTTYLNSLLKKNSKQLYINLIKHKNQEFDTLGFFNT